MGEGDVGELIESKCQLLHVKVNFCIFLVGLDLAERDLDQELLELGLVAVDQMVEVLAGLELVEQDGEVFEIRWIGLGL